MNKSSLVLRCNGMPPKPQRAYTSVPYGAISMSIFILPHYQAPLSRCALPPELRRTPAFFHMNKPRNLRGTWYKMPVRRRPRIILAKGHRGQVTGDKTCGSADSTPAITVILSRGVIVSATVPTYTKPTVPCTSRSIGISSLFYSKVPAPVAMQASICCARWIRAGKKGGSGAMQLAGSTLAA